MVVSMTLQGFWDLIDAAAVCPDVDDRIRAVMSQMEGLEDGELASFRDLLRTQLDRAATPLVFAAGVLLTGRSLDTAERFEEFRCLMLLRGSEFFEKILAQPDHLAEFEFSQQEKELEFDADMLLYAPYFAYQEKHGEESDLDTVFPPSEQGPALEPPEPFTTEQLQQLFPRLWPRRRAMIPPRETDTPA